MVKIMGGPGRKEEVSKEEILQAIALHPDPVVTAGEVADEVDMTNAGVNKRLKQFVEEGLVVRKKVGARAVIYWLTDDGRQAARDG